jgi:endo-1,4-beta-xylanase
MNLIDRRALLLGAAAAFGGRGTPALAKTEASPVGSAHDGLNAQARARGLFYGSAIDQNMLANDPAYMDHVARECGMLVSEYSMKWGTLRPTPTTFDFSAGDKLLAFARKHGIPMRGHTLAWHMDNPPWLVSDLKPGNAEKILTKHAQTVVKHFKNRLVHWDVVNEVLWAKDGKPGGMRDSLWYRALGDRYIDIAFHTCAEADPTALRCINDYGLDYALPDDERKRHDMLNLLAALLKRGVPVQALGIQGHITAGNVPFDPRVMEQFINDVTSMGLKVLLTEVDVRDNDLPADLAPRDAGVAAAGAAYLDAVLKNPHVIGVLTWGLSDRRSWLNDELPRADHLPQRALPLDTELQRKPLWSAMAASFQKAPQRT